ncbi:MAG: ABC transporter ATP-binding protein [Ignavibacteriaceae bacterium]|nr:ABC transporter ATP-binding protein [Ignavibacteriaceae bacterium]
MKTYFRILRYAKKYWHYLAVSMACTILYAALNGASVYLSIPLLDTLFQESAQRTEQAVKPTQTDSMLPSWLKDIKDSAAQSFNNFIFTNDKLESLFRICIVILFAFLAKNLAGYAQAYFLTYVEQGIMNDLRNEAYRHLHKLPMSYFKNERVGNLISRIINDANVVQTSISAAFLNAIREPLTIIVFLGIAISISWQLTLLALIILPFSMLIISWIGLKLRRHSGMIQEKMADITSIIQETISGVKIVKAFGMEEYENEKFGNQTRRFFRMMLRLTRTRNLSSPLTEFLSICVGVVIIYYGGKLVLIDHSLKASEFMGFLFAIFQMMPPIKELSSVNNRIQESSAAGDRIFEIIDTEPLIRNIPGAVEVSGLKDEITFDNISFHYDDSPELVLNNVDFKVKKGEIIALVGPSGGGKSTLVDLIPRFFDPSSGKIMIDGVDIKTISIESLRKLMGIVTQETILFNESIRKNIAYGLGEHPMDEIQKAAKLANAHNFIMELPEGYDTIIGERGLKISGGQRQRISIARALLKNPQIMIFDEATSALDNESEQLVQEAIDRMMINRTTFVIAHRLSTIKNATRIIVIDRGRIVQLGAHDELIADESGIYKRLYEMQFRDHL